MTGMRSGFFILGAAALLFALGWLVDSGTIPLPPGFVIYGAAAMVAAVLLSIPGAIKAGFGYLRARDEAAPEAPPSGGGIPLPCPRCARTTFRLQRVRLSEFTFLVLAMQFRHSYHTACPRCLRRAIEENLMDNLASANVLWFVVGIEGLVGLAKTFRAGHAPEILQQLQAAQRLSPGS
jgi:hypothetical protein